MSKGKRKIERIEEEILDEDYIAKLSMTPMQREAVKLVYMMRTLRSSQIARLLGYYNKYALEQLNRLYYHRLLDRRFLDEEKKAHNNKGSSQGIYFLDAGGKIFISGYMDMKTKGVNWKPIDNLVNYDKLRHTLDSAEIITRVMEECRKYEYKVVDYRGERHLWTAYKYQNLSREFAPDLYFKVLKGTYTYSFFVENDEATMSVPAFLAKIPQYDDYKISGQYDLDYEGAFPRVLVITTSKKRAFTLAREVGKTQTSKIDFFFTWQEIYYEAPLGSNTFIHTSVDRYPQAYSMFDEVPEAYRGPTPKG